MSMGPNAVPGEITMLLQQARSGKPGAIDDLFALVYDELRLMARQQFGHGPRGSSLDGTALVHAACERLLGADAIAGGDGPAEMADAASVEGNGGLGGRVLDAENRRHLYFMFQRAMHDALVAHVRSEMAQKRGGDRERVSMVEFEADGAVFAADIFDLRSALEEMREVDPDGTQMVMLRFFCGRSLRDAADIMDCSLAVARRHWDYAKAWLHERLSRSQGTK